MTTTITPLLTLVNDADAITGWTGLVTLDVDAKIQGTGCVGAKVSGATTAGVYTLPTTDLSATHIYVWMNSLTAATLATFAAGGIRVRAGANATNYAEWDLAGSDTYPGGWRCFTIDTASTPTRVVGTPNLASSTIIGAVFSAVGTIMGNFSNCLADVIRYGTGLQITAGTAGAPSTFAEVVAIDSAQANAYGILRNEAGVFFCQGKLIVGTGAAAAVFVDLNTVTVFEPNPVSLTHYEVQVAALATMRLGSYAGSVSQSGCTVTAASGYRWALSVAGTLELYACSIGRARLVTLTATSVVRDTSFSNCGLITPAGALMRDCTFAGSTDPVAMTISSPAQMDQIALCGFLGNQIALRITGVGTYTFNGVTFSGNVTDIRNESGGLVTINATNGSNPATVTNGAGSTTVINNAKSLSFTGLQPNSELRIFRTSDNVELFAVENTGTTASYSYPYTADTPVYVHIANVTYVFVRLELTLTANDASVPVQQRFDRVYANP